MNTNQYSSQPRCYDENDNDNDNDYIYTEQHKVLRAEQGPCELSEDVVSNFGEQ